MLRRFGEFFAGAKTPHYDFDEVIVSADCILEFTGCMNEDSEEKVRISFALKTAIE